MRRGNGKQITKNFKNHRKNVRYFLSSKAFFERFLPRNEKPSFKLMILKMFVARGRVPVVHGCIKGFVGKKLNPPTQCNTTIVM